MFDEYVLRDIIHFKSDASSVGMDGYFEKPLKNNIFVCREKNIVKILFVNNINIL